MTGTFFSGVLARTAAAAVILMEPTRGTVSGLTHTQQKIIASLPR